MKQLCSILCIVMISLVYGGEFYVAPDGDDANAGTIDQPVESIQQGQALASPGDTVWIRGGTYQMREDQISSIQQNLFACVTFLDKSGLPGQTIKYWAYPGETPVFDYSNVAPAGRRNVGIWVHRGTEYLHIKGLEMTGMQVTITTHTESYCIYSWGDNNIFENISMYDNLSTALRHRRGGNNLFLNCDAYRNHDTVSQAGLGVNVDGFGCHPTNADATGNVFMGCRAWFNSDDGFDIIRSDHAIVFIDCWAFNNGYSTSFQSLGDGNGFKAGGYAFDPANEIPDPVPRNTIQNCIAVRNKANGFYSNHHLTGNDWINNSAYQNATNFNMANRESAQAANIGQPGYDHVLTNNLSYDPVSQHTQLIDTSANTLTTNTFTLGMVLDDSDFVSLAESLLTAPRKADGSLPDIDFLRPAQGSALIDAGVDAGLPFSGAAPDLGAFETDYPVAIEAFDETVPEGIHLFQNYPNPFNPSTAIRYSLRKAASVRLTVYNFLGQEIRVLQNGYQKAGVHAVIWDGTNAAGNAQASGVYFYRLSVSDSGGERLLQKMMVLLK